MKKAALVLGATGGIGGAVMRRLIAGGWTVRALTRRANVALPQGCEAVTGDAMDVDAVTSAAEGASVIVHAVNPPGYRDWDRLVLPMLDNTIRAASESQARVLLPGTVYNFGPDVFPNIDEFAPQTPKTRKGKIRVEMEQRLGTAAQRGRCKALIVRAGDFFGPGAANNWFGQGLVTAGARPKVIRNPGAVGVGHQWAYLPDVAETMVRLLERADLPAFASFHMEGHWDHDGRQMVQAIARVMGDPVVPVRPLPWWVLRIAALVATTPREMMEMRYLWQRPVRMTNARLVETLGDEPRTPLLEAVRATLNDLQCL